MPGITVWDLGDILGGPRYYPPGRHPATRRMREQIVQLVDLQQRAERLYEMGGPVPSPDVAQALAYLRAHLAQFEQAESEARARDHLMLRGRA